MRHKEFSDLEWRRLLDAGIGPLERRPPSDDCASTLPSLKKNHSSPNALLCLRRGASSLQASWVRTVSDALRLSCPRPPKPQRHSNPLPLTHLPVRFYWKI